MYHLTELFKQQQKLHTVNIDKDIVMDKIKTLENQRDTITKYDDIITINSSIYKLYELQFEPQKITGRKLYNYFLWKTTRSSYEKQIAEQEFMLELYIDKYYSDIRAFEGDTTKKCNICGYSELDYVSNCIYNCNECKNTTTFDINNYKYNEDNETNVRNSGNSNNGYKKITGIW